MVTAIILAGGSGTRMGAAIPKQFIEVNGKPILVYTLDKFQDHPMIDNIVVVCISGWEKEVWGYADKYHLNKISKVLQGGNSAIESIANGVKSLDGSSEDIVVIHDGVRPLVEERMITDVINASREYGAAMSAILLKEHIFIFDENNETNSYLSRKNSIRSSTPQAYDYSLLQRAFKNNTSPDTAYASTLMADCGITLHCCYGTEKNFKITTKQDVELFRALLQLEVNDEKED